MRRTAAHWAPLSSEVFMPLVLASADLGIHNRCSSTGPGPGAAPGPAAGQPRWMRLKREVTTGSAVWSSRHTVSVTMKVMVLPLDSLA